MMSSPKALERHLGCQLLNVKNFLDRCRNPLKSVH